MNGTGTQIQTFDAASIEAFIQANPHAFMPGETFGDGNGISQAMTDYQVHEKDRTIAMFYPRAELDKVRTRAEKAPRYRMVPHIRMMQPGETSLVLDRPVRDEDRNRFPQEWARFESRQANTAMGTPLEAMFPLHPDIVLTLRAHNIPTVEALASLSDAAISNMGLGAQQMKDRARRYLIAVTNPEGIKMAERDEQLEKAIANNIALVQKAKMMEDRLAAMEAELAAVRTGQSIGPMGVIPGATAGQAAQAGPFAGSPFTEPLGDEISEADWDQAVRANLDANRSAPPAITDQSGGQAAVTAEKRGPGRPSTKPKG